MNTELNSRINQDDFKRTSYGHQKDFEFSNMFSYGENNLVRFDRLARYQRYLYVRMQVVNHHSSIQLCFCIYDKTSRTTSSKNILNNRKDNFYCKFNFEIDGVDYFIERRPNGQEEVLI